MPGFEVPSDWDTFRPSACRRGAGKPLRILLLLVISALFILFGLIGWPGFHWDASFFVPVIINVAKGKSWLFDGYSYFSLFRGNNNYDFHGIVQILFFGSFLRASSVDVLLLLMALVNISTFFVYSRIYAFSLSRHGRDGPWLALLLALIPAVIGLGLQGRPEQLLPLVFSIPVLVLQRHGDRESLDWIYPFTAFIAVITSPLPGIVYGVAVTVYFLSKGDRFLPNSRSIITYCAGSFCGLAFVFVLFRAFVPFSIVTWFVNVFMVGSDTAQFEIPDVLNFRAGRWGYTIAAPFCNLVFISGILVWLAKLIRNKRLLAMALLLLSLHPLMSHLADYGYSCFVPLIVMLALDQDNSLFQGKPLMIKLRLFRRGAFALGMMYFYVLMLLLIFSADGLFFGTSLRSTRSFLASQGLEFSDTSPLVAYSDVTRPSLVALTDNPRSMLTLVPRNDVDEIAGFGPNRNHDYQVNWLASLEKLYGRKVGFYLHQQRFPYLRGDLPQAVRIESIPFDLVESSWKDWGFWLRFLPMPKALPTRYSVAVYKRRDLNINP
jgi:hypothetical protein